MPTKETAAEIEVEVEAEPGATESETPEVAAVMDAEPGVETAEAEEFVVSIGDETPEAQQPEKLPGWMRALTKNHRNVVAENNKLRKRLEELEKAPGRESSANRLRSKPTLEGHDFDKDKYESDLDEWYKEKTKTERDAEDAARTRQQSEASDRQAWDAQLQKHEKAKKELPVNDYDDAEENVFALLDQTQRGIVINYSDNSALLTYALHRNPAKLQDLAAIKDPGRFIREMTKLESQLKTSKRRPSTTPESRVERVATGKTLNSAAGLEKLRAEAAKTGDFSKVMQYKREMKQRAAK